MLPWRESLGESHQIHNIVPDVNVRTRFRSKNCHWLSYSVKPTHLYDTATTQKGTAHMPRVRGVYKSFPACLARSGHRMEVPWLAVPRVATGQTREWPPRVSAEAVAEGG